MISTRSMSREAPSSSFRLRKDWLKGIVSVQPSLNHKLAIFYLTLDMAAREVMLQEVDKVFTEQDNVKVLTLPTAQDVKKVISKSNLYAAPGTDGVPSLLYTANAGM